MPPIRTHVDQLVLVAHMIFIIDFIESISLLNFFCKCKTIYLNKPNKNAINYKIKMLYCAVL